MASGNSKGLGVGLIGSGFMGKCHALAWNAVAPTFGDLPPPRLVALADVEPALATARAKEFGFSRGTTDWRSLIADADIDVISITAPNAFHAEMAIAALEAGKHVWCEKPMATALADAERMAVAAERAGLVAALGYNYIQNPLVRHMARLLKAGAIGVVNHIRIEMDEDFMADPTADFAHKHGASSGHGSLDDFGVHTLALLEVLVGRVSRVVCHMARPYAEMATPGGGSRAVETHDAASALIEIGGGRIAGSLQMNRAAWGRKGRIAIQVFGALGALDYEQERMNELRLYEARGPQSERGFRTILASPHHPPYDRFLPAPGHGLGFNDLKVIEAREFVRRIDGEPAHLLTFAEGIVIERTVEAMARSFKTGGWVDI